MMIRNKINNILLYTVAIVFSLTMIFPLLWMLSSSLKSVAEIFAQPPHFIPKKIMWSNYSEVWQLQNWGLYFFNSLKVTVFATLLSLSACTMAAYAFARLNFRFKNIGFVILLGTMMIPSQILMIPTFQILSNLGLVNTHGALILPWLFQAFGIFMLRQFFVQVPKELEEAAFIDGCGYLRVFWIVVVRNSYTAILSLAVFDFIWSWGNFFNALLYLNDGDLRTLPLALASFQGSYVVQWNSLMAASVITIVPVLIIFLFAQKYFIQAVMMSGMKE